MFYREVGQFKSTYAADMAIFPIRQDRIGIAVLLALAVVVIPLVANDFVLASIMIPGLIFTLAAIGLNILTGYAGQISLGTGAFMGVGAYAAFKLAAAFPQVNVLVWILVSGFFSAGVGVIFGLPSLRIKGLYLAVTTLAAQFFLEWCFIRVGWLTDYSSSGAIEAARRSMFGISITGPEATPLARYFAVLGLVVFLTFIASNLVHGRIGRTWMMVRDMDIAAELMGVKLLPAKLSAFAVSSYFAGVAGAMMVFFWLGAAEPSAFGISLSFQVLFMVIIGGLGSMIGSYFGAAFIWALPVVIKFAPDLFGFEIQSAAVEHVNDMIVGALIIFFLIVEPHGLARLWGVTKQKLRVWPFPW
jgi:branched-chain amino acid transport system permease protein